MRRASSVGVVAGLAAGMVLGLGILARGGWPAAGDPAAAQSGTGRVLLPMLLGGEELALLPAPPTLRPASPTPTPRPEPSETPGPTATLGPQLCEGGLQRWPVVSALDLDGARPRAPERRGMHPRQPLYLAPVEGSGRAWLAWAATDAKVHVTPLDGLMRDGKDVTLDGDASVGLAAGPDGGFGVAVIRGEQVALAAYDADGKRRWDKTLIGDNPHTRAGDKWVDSWGHEGRLVWTGSHYALYMGHTQEFGANGKHQGDLLWLFDPQGNAVLGRQIGQPGWDWGCSHSLDLRMVWSAGAGALGPVCLSDAYPQKAIMYSHQRARVWPEPSGNGSGGSDGRLGGLVPTETGFSFSFATKETRKSYDIALVDIRADGTVGEPLWLTSSQSVDEESPHHQPFGADWFFGWHENGALRLALFEAGGRLLAGPVNAPAGAGIDPRDDFVAWADGGLAWAARDDAAGSLQLVHVPLCLRPTD
ncbi:MAG: hypothetical protein H6648_02325 [Caldilineae bacterium]|nr:hypothetical protein [Chloroflexota bacterium]MCB9175968.1 hypothetical protein [Caldilineae bacterium]